MHFCWLQKQVENALYDENEELYQKWRLAFNKYLKLKVKSWTLLSETKNEIFVCRICVKKFKETIFKEHSAECFELFEWKKELKKKNEEVVKACEIAFEKKQELSVTAVLQQKWVFER